MISLLNRPFYANFDIFLQFFIFVVNIEELHELSCVTVFLTH